MVVFVHHFLTKLKKKHSESQINRWLEIVAAYDFEIEHRTGRQHANADAMSQRPF